jgi:hypothetical protein
MQSKFVGLYVVRLHDKGDMDQQEAHGGSDPSELRRGRGDRALFGPQ